MTTVIACTLTALVVWLWIDTGARMRAAYKAGYEAGLHRGACRALGIGSPSRIGKGAES